MTTGYMRDEKTKECYETKCHGCGRNVFFYADHYGGVVLFDSLGKPWPIHNCAHFRSPQAGGPPNAPAPPLGRPPQKPKEGPTICTLCGGLARLEDFEDHLLQKHHSLLDSVTYRAKGRSFTTFKCIFCSSRLLRGRFKVHALLNHHDRIRAGRSNPTDQEIVCNQCGPKFSAYGYREHYWTVHNPKKPKESTPSVIEPPAKADRDRIVCMRCAPRFDMDHFLRHVKIHIKKRLKSDQQSGKVSAASSQYSYYCMFCGLPLKKSDYRSHVLSCHGNEFDRENRVACPECAPSFGDSDQFRRHLKKKHPT